MLWRTASHNLLLTPLAQHCSSIKSHTKRQPFFNTSGITELLLLLLLFLLPAFASFAFFQFFAYKEYNNIPLSLI